MLHKIVEKVDYPSCSLVGKHKVPCDGYFIDYKIVHFSLY